MSRVIRFQLFGLVLSLGLSFAGWACSDMMHNFDCGPGNGGVDCTMLFWPGFQILSHGYSVLILTRLVWALIVLTNSFIYVCVGSGAALILGVESTAISVRARSIALGFAAVALYAYIVLAFFQLW